MKNKEKYAEDIIALAICGFNIACYKKTKELVACETLDCEKCMFNSDGNCTAFRRSWFESEVELTVEDELKSELETVKKERDELRARLEKAVELPVNVEDTIYCIRDCGTVGYRIEENTVSEIVFEYNNRMRIRTSYGLFGYENWIFGVDCFADNAEAKVRLKELLGGEERK